jgi:simple sugar transport system substrate-binding protein
MSTTDPYLAFTGQPIKDQSGKVRIENGTTPTIEFLESIDWLVEGVTGTIPR